MPDSDATEPAVDDFESRFFEMDDLDNESDDLSESTTSSLLHSVQKYEKEYKLHKSSHQKKPQKFNKTRKKTCKIEESFSLTRRPIRQRRTPVAFDDAASDDEDDGDMYHERQVALKCSSSRTRTGYQHSQSSLWSLEEMGMNTMNSLAPAPAPVVSAEQKAERERKIIQRRESAKQKSELEKHATVEKLLRINTDYNGISGKIRCRGRRSTIKPEAGGTSGGEDDGEEDENGDKVALKRNSFYPSATLDPPAGHIRLISSSRLTPHSMVALPVKTRVSSLLFHRLRMEPLLPTTPRICAQCNVNPRRYACPSTGVSLCSFECFKVHMATRTSVC